jgi:hypothetical protein
LKKMNVPFAAFQGFEKDECPLCCLCLSPLLPLPANNATADRFFGGMVSFEAAKGDLKKVHAELLARNVRVAGGPDRMRVATHIFTQSTELNTFFDAVDRGLRA